MWNVNEMWKYTGSREQSKKLPIMTMLSNVQNPSPKEGLQLQSPIRVPQDIFGLIDAEIEMQDGDATNARMVECDECVIECNKCVTTARGGCKRQTLIGVRQTRKWLRQAPKRVVRLMQATNA